MFRRVFVIQCFPLNGFVLFAETDVTIHVQRGDMFGKLRDGNGATNFAGHFTGSFPVDYTGRVASLASRRIIQVVVRGVETFPKTR